MNLERPADRFAGYNEFKAKDVRLQDNYWAGKKLMWKTIMIQWL